MHCDCDIRVNKVVWKHASLSPMRQITNGAAGVSGAPGAPGTLSGSEEEEPRLKYGPLGEESPRGHAVRAASRLCVSDKVLAVGHFNGSVQLLDHLGDEVG